MNTIISCFHAVIDDGIATKLGFNFFEEDLVLFGFNGREVIPAYKIAGATFDIEFLKDFGTDVERQSRDGGTFDSLSSESAKEIAVGIPGKGVYD